MNPKRITLANLADATAQEVFDQAVLGTMAQGERAGINGACAYRTPDGLKCAAGQLMSDAEAKELPNHKPWGQLSTREGVPCAHAELILGLQAVHDRRLPEEWQASFRWVAIMFGLDPAAAARPLGRPL